MSQALARRNLTPASLRQTRGARSVLLRMAADDARAERIKQLKEDNPAETWSSIAEAIGVKERSALEWQRTGGISYDNAKKLAAHFSCDLDWLWRGKKAELPDLMGALDGKSQLDRVEAKITQLLDAGAALEARQTATEATLAVLAEAVAALRRETRRQPKAA